MIRSQKFWLVALFLSKFGDLNKANKYAPPEELCVTFWKDAYQLFFNNLGDGRNISTFEHSLKNSRDTFDSHIKKSTRIGWKDTNGRAAALPKEAIYIYNKYKNVNREDLWAEIQTSVLNTVNTIKTENVSEVAGKNPNWNREELILALDLYFDLDQGQMHKSNDKIIALSNLLRDLSVHENIPDIDKFRNPSGVARRLGNFKAMDSGYTGDGLSNSGKLAKMIFDEFRMHRGRLKQEADLIKQLVKTRLRSLAEPLPSYGSSEKHDFKFNYHKNLELNPLTLRLKKGNLTTDQITWCSLCNLSTQKLYGALGNDLIELHYTREINTESCFSYELNLDDFILVCPTCHKLLDYHYSILASEDLKRIISGK